MAKQTETDQNRPEQTRTDQNRTEQNRTEQNRTEQTRTEQTRIGQNRPEARRRRRAHLQIAAEEEVAVAAGVGEESLVRENLPAGREDWR
jgi:hypothetical protein